MVKHKNGSMIPVSYFINGPVEGLDIFQVWMAISTPVSENLTCYTLDSTRNRSLAPSHSIAKVCGSFPPFILHFSILTSFTLLTGYFKK